MGRISEAKARGAAITELDKEIEFLKWQQLYPAGIHVILPQKEKEDGRRTASK